MKSEEHDAQVALFQWADLETKKHPCLKYLFSTLNGVKLPIGLAVKCKKAGMKKGVLDNYLLVGRGEWHGLVIELKKEKGGVVSKEQDKWMSHHEANGFKCFVCKGFWEAKTAIEWYLKQ